MGRGAFHVKGAGEKQFVMRGPVPSCDVIERHEARNVLLNPAPGHHAMAQKAAGPDTFHYKPPLPSRDVIQGAAEGHRERQKPTVAVLLSQMALSPI